MGDSKYIKLKFNNKVVEVVNKDSLNCFFRCLSLKNKNALIYKVLIGSIISAFFFGCATVPAPIEDYVLSKTAIESAKKSEAMRFAPGIFQQAELIFYKAEKLFEEKEYIEAEKEFIKARKLAEKAENQSRLKKAVQGETF